MPAPRGLKKDSDRALTPATEAARVPAHLMPPGSPEAKQLHRLHAQLSVGAELPKLGQRKSMRAGSLWLCPTLCDPVTVACQASLSGGVLQARILERIGQCWLPYPSRALYFLLPWPSTPLRTWSCQNPCDPSSCTTSSPGPHRGQTQGSRAASGASPRGRRTCRGGNKTTSETQGRCG